MGRSALSQARSLDSTRTWCRVVALRRAPVGAPYDDVVEDVRETLADRDHLTAAVTAPTAAAGAACVRVHDVGSSRDAIAVATVWRGHS